MQWVEEKVPKALVKVPNVKGLVPPKKPVTI
jgi:hypothetical protein